jgi:hypothetical protein
LDRKHDATGKFLNGTLERMVETYPETYGKLKNYDDHSEEAVSWKAWNDVMIRYNRQKIGHVPPEWKQHGPLMAGFGGIDEEIGTAMGPELSFGQTVGDALKEDKSDIPNTIFIIKIA